MVGAVVLVAAMCGLCILWVVVGVVVRVLARCALLFVFSMCGWDMAVWGCGLSVPAVLWCGTYHGLCSGGFGVGRGVGGLCVGSFVFGRGPGVGPFLL